MTITYACTRNRRVTATSAFVSAARSYWLDVFPVVRHELRRLHIEACRIPDPILRYLALDTLAVKWSSLEGAAAFATFVTPALRPAVVRLLVDYQAIFDYADTLMEQPNGDPAANGRQLHAALLAILEPDRPHPDYYRHHVGGNDGGYLTRLVEGCRSIVAELPAYAPLAATVIESTRRVVEYQCRVSLSTAADHPGLSRWALHATPHHRRLQWWETCASCGSSLGTLALLAAAANPQTNGHSAEAIETLYWPWAGALHVLLDDLIDRADDAANSQPNLLDLYASPRELAERLGFLTTESVRLASVAAPTIVSSWRVWRASTSPTGKRGCRRLVPPRKAFSKRLASWQRLRCWSCVPVASRSVAPESAYPVLDTY